MILQGMGISHFFTGVISNQDTSEPKPSPQPYLTLFEKYKINPNECLILEDSPHGIESARSSGGRVYCVRNCDDVTIENIINAIQKEDL
jgi:HAD superfamily hydrolase (TIGR01509 family)